MLTLPPPNPVATAHQPPGTVLLERFYRRMGLPPPRLQLLRADEVPSPYHELLVHSSDMTPTLEAFWQRPLGLAVLSRVREGESYFREVVLKVAIEGWPVEYGIIRIYLDHFPAEARRLVLAERLPLGKILEIEAVAHLSWPQAFFRVHSDERIANVLNLSEPCDLYGRRNVLLDGSRRLLAEVIEILPPVDTQPSEAC